MLCQRARSYLVVLSWICFAIACVGPGCASGDKSGDAPSGSNIGDGTGSGASGTSSAPGGAVGSATGGSETAGAANTGTSAAGGTGDSPTAVASNPNGGSTNDTEASPSGGTSDTSAGSGAGDSPSGGASDASGVSADDTGASPTGGTSADGAEIADGTGDSPAGDSSGASMEPQAPEPFTFGEPPTAAQYFKKGINLGNRLEAPNEGDWGSSVLASDFPFIAQRGFDHVRIPIRFSGHALSSAPYTIDATFFERIDTVLDQATAAGLAVIIDMHAYDEMASDPSSERERFLALWSQIAVRYQGRPDTIAFELLNEPNTMLDSMWNEIAAAAITTVRATNPRRLLVVDTVFWGDPSELSSLTLPDDANLLVSVHIYEPKLFSFQGKSWMGDIYMTTGVVFPGPPAASVTPVQAALDESWAASWFDDYNAKPAAENPSGPATLDAQLAYVTAYQAETGRTVYNGEWGPQDGADMTSRANLVMMVRERCEAEGIGWAIWEDTNNMQLFDSTDGTWVTPIVDALLPQ